MHKLPLANIVAGACAVLGFHGLAPAAAADGEPAYRVPVSANTEPMATGKFQPTWESLQQYQTPEWYRNAKFGIWAHWGPQCQPEQGDWFARGMYEENGGQYKWFLANYGPQSKFGFKEVIRDFKAGKWDPERLMKLYKRAGAQYFFALANHHDNFDLYDSKYQPWNSVNLDPKKDLIGGWAKAARDNGLRFGVSVHAAHAWSWYEPSQRADKAGPNAGVPYDGKLTKADGKGQWWEGYDPQDLYAQNHPLSPQGNIHRLWDWPQDGSVILPDQAYCDKFYNRTVDLINKYQPDLIYFDDTILPLDPISDAGIKIAAHFYNSNMAHHGGKLEGVINGKILNEMQRKTMVWDIERGQSNQVEPYVWQSDTCLGDWHYNKSRFDRHSYKNAATVIQVLADVVSKNGNMLLSVPVKGDGTIDADEENIVNGIAAWMDVNKESIFDTRPWKIYGEGPSTEKITALNGQGFNEGKTKFGPTDVRFTTKNGALYAILLGVPTEDIAIKSVGMAAKLTDKAVDSVALLGSADPVRWSQNDDALAITVPPGQPGGPLATVYKITFKP